MIQHVWTVLCSRSVIDSETNGISLIEVIEEVTLSGVPQDDVETALKSGKTILVPFAAELASLWTRGPDNAPFRSQGRALFRVPDGKMLLGTASFDIDLTTYQRVRTRTRIPGLPVTGPGTYVFHVQMLGSNEEWADVAKIPIVLKFDFSGAEAGTVATVVPSPVPVTGSN